MATIGSITGLADKPGSGTSNMVNLMSQHKLRFEKLLQRFKPKLHTFLGIHRINSELAVRSSAWRMAENRTTYCSILWFSFCYLATKKRYETNTALANLFFALTLTSTIAGCGS
jgi:hypothetical protein